MIEMNGRNYRQSVTKQEFEEVYQQKGWWVDESQFKTEQEVVNYNKMKNVKDKKFDDDLFKRG